jgi:5-oxoprolinase (ATP-hydrolysing) subunit A
MLLDLNADLGEGAGFDADLMRLVTSANVCCGAHAGSADETAATLALARGHGVAVGAHPGYPDRANFGRTPVAAPSNTLYAQISHQLAGFVAAAQRAGVAVRYVKPHGAMYNQAAADPAFANVVCSAVAGWALPVMGLPGSRMEAMCAALGLPFVAEGFADRRYRPDGSLVPRTEADAFVHDPAEAVAQIEQLVRERGVTSVCVHGDNPEAVVFTAAVRDGLVARGFTLRAFAA